jgi:homoserine trans-succinylase
MLYRILNHLVAISPQLIPRGVALTTRGHQVPTTLLEDTTPGSYYLTRGHDTRFLLPYSRTRHQVPTTLLQDTTPGSYYLTRGHDTRFLLPYSRIQHQVPTTLLEDTTPGSYYLTRGYKVTNDLFFHQQSVYGTNYQLLS